MSEPGAGDRGVGVGVRPEVCDPSAAAARRARMLLVALIALGLTVRLALVFVMPEGKAAPTPDAWANLRIARSLAAGEGFALPAEPRSDEARLRAEGSGPAPEVLVSQRLADRMPGYPLMVAAALRQAEEGLRLLAVSQAVLGAITMALAAYLAWRLAGVWAAAAAAALLVFDPYQVYACSVVLPLVPLGVVLAALVGAGLKFIDVTKQGGRAWPWAALAGVFAAAAVYLDWRMAGLAVVVGLAALVAPGRKRYLAGWAVGLAVLVVALAPWVVRNANCVGRPVLTTSLGAGLYEGACEDSLPADTDKLEETARNDLYLAAAWKAIAGDPLGWLKRVAARAAEIWSPWPVRESGGLPLPAVAGYTSLLPAAALALVGAWTLRRRSAVLVWLLAAPVYVTIAGAMLAGGAEDRLPLAPTLAILGGAGLAALIGQPKNSLVSRPS
ncbi:MAG: hypothetical protein NT049_15795 [Planctomycetota bacterium]|nr:hypothetical protein [Planctomycetota bacterium]